MKPSAVRINQHDVNQYDPRASQAMNLEGNIDQEFFQKEGAPDNLCDTHQFDESELFNDILDGGGADPSINDSIRDSIKYSFVSSENDFDQQQQNAYPPHSTTTVSGGNTNQSGTNVVRDTYVMNRLNWITYLKVLFDELESFTNANQVKGSAKLKHVDSTNFLKALRKIKSMLPLQPKLEYLNTCGEMAFSYKEVEQVLSQRMDGQSKYITWDNVIDMFLSSSSSSRQQTGGGGVIMIDQKQNKATNPQKKFHQHHHLMTEESMISADVNLKDDEEEETVTNQKQPTNNPGGRVRKVHQKNEEFFVSFADSVIKMNTNTISSHTGGIPTSENVKELATSAHIVSSQKQMLIGGQQNNIILAQAPLLKRGNTASEEGERFCQIESSSSDDDENCEAGDSSDSDKSNNSIDHEESKVSLNHNRRRQRSELEESVRSSHTANFKEQKQQQTGNTPQALPPPVTNTSQVITTFNTQDSYYATIGNGQPNLVTLNSSNVIGVQQPSTQKKHNANQYRNLDQVQAYLPYSTLQSQDQQQQHPQLQSKASSRCSSRRGMEESIDNFQDQRADAKKYQSQKELFHHQSQQQIDNEQAVEQQQHHPLQHSSTLNFKNLQEHQNTATNKNTLLIKSSLLASTNSLSAHSANTVNQGGNYLDLDFQRKDLKVFNLDIKQQTLQKQAAVIRSVNIAQNQLTRFPNSMGKSLQFLNISSNKLKSLSGIEACINLKFLNASNNFISSVQGIVILQSLRELILACNLLTSLKEIGQLKNLQLLDISYNKLVDLEKLQPLSQLRKLQTLVAIGNHFAQQNNYEMALKKLIPQVQVLDPDTVKDFSQFQEMEHMCFPDVSQISEGYDNQSLIQFNNHERLQLDLSDQDLPLIIASGAQPNNYNNLNNNNYGATRSRTPLRIEELKQTTKSPVRTSWQNTQKSGKQQQQQRLHDNKSKTRAKVAPTTTKAEASKTYEILQKSRLRDRSANSNNNTTVKNTTSQQIRPSKEHEQPTAQIERKMQANLSLAQAIVTQNRLQAPTTNLKQYISTANQNKKIPFNKTTANISVTTLDLSDLNKQHSSNEGNHTASVKSILAKGKPQAYNSMITSKKTKPAEIVITSLKQKHHQRPGTSKDQTFEEGLVVPEAYYKGQMQQPLTARAANEGKQKRSFVFESQEPPVSQSGRITPVHQQFSNIAIQRPSTQLQRFLNNAISKNPSSRQSSQTPQTVHSLPHQHLQMVATTLPPRIAYQSKLENPGDKKSKADNHSLLSSSRGGLNTSSQLQTTARSGVMNQSIKALHQQQNLESQSSSSTQNIVQTGGTEEDVDDFVNPNNIDRNMIQPLTSVAYYRVNDKQTNNTLQCRTVGGSSGGSMSPVFNENMGRLKLGGTSTAGQAAGKQKQNNKQ